MDNTPTSEVAPRQVVHVSLELLQGWHCLLSGDGDKFIAARKVADGIKSLLLNGTN